MTADRPYLGIGWKFPIQVGPDGKISSSKQETKIEESIFLILSTSKGERPTLPKFGCGIHDLVFAPNNSATLGQVAATIQEALVLYEPRIDVIDINVSSPPGQENVLLIRIDYRIRANNARANMVYPYYITEGG
jgi:uncharacterized protein